MTTVAQFLKNLRGATILSVEPSQDCPGQTLLSTYDGWGESFEVTVKTKDGREYSFIA